MVTATMTQPPDSRYVNPRNLSPNTAMRASAENERFPSFDEATPPTFGLLPVSESPAEAKPVEYKWPSRRGSQRLLQNRNPGAFGHRPRRSLSDAINRFRTRQGSVSENAQEIAEALKAPISYKLIVSVNILQK